MRFLIKKVNKELEEIEITNDWKSITSILGGYMETVNLEPLAKGSIIAIVDEDGKLKHLKPNAFNAALNDTLVGDILFTAFNGEDDFEDIDVERAKKVISKTLIF